MDLSIAAAGANQVAIGQVVTGQLAGGGQPAGGGEPTQIAAATPAQVDTPPALSTRTPPAPSDLPSIRDISATSGHIQPNRIGSGILDRLDRIQARDLDHGRRPSEGEPVLILDGSAPSGPNERAFDAQMDMLQMTFDHAVEVELAAKTGTGVSSSMNKLMSGS